MRASHRNTLALLLAAAVAACIGGGGDDDLGVYPPPTAIEVLRYSPSGAPDTGFGAGKGFVIANLSRLGAAAFSVMLQADGKIVIVGNSSAGSAQTVIAVLRYIPDGTLDSAFGNSGVVLTAIGSLDADFPVAALQADGKIVVAGTTFAPFAGTGGFFVARYNPDGTLDTAFASGGILASTIGSGGASVKALAFQADGKILLAGRTNNGAVLVFRLNTDGTFDPGFGSAGAVTHARLSNTGTSHDAIAVQSDGKIVVGADNVVLRYNADGSPDSAFAAAGVSSITPFSEIDAIALQPDDKIVAAGSQLSGSGRDFAVFRLNADGTPDIGFGASGSGLIATDVRFDNTRALLLQPDGKIIIAGFATTGLDDEVVLLRYMSDGFLDTTFGANGMVVRPATGPSVIAGANAMALQADGDIVVAGYD